MWVCVCVVFGCIVSLIVRLSARLCALNLRAVGGVSVSMMVSVSIGAHAKIVVALLVLVFLVVLV